MRSSRADWRNFWSGFRVRSEAQHRVARFDACRLARHRVLESRFVIRGPGSCGIQRETVPGGLWGLDATISCLRQCNPVIFAIITNNYSSSGTVPLKLLFKFEKAARFNRSTACASFPTDSAVPFHSPPRFDLPTALLHWHWTKNRTHVDEGACPPDNARSGRSARVSTGRNSGQNLGRGRTPRLLLHLHRDMNSSWLRFRKQLPPVKRSARQEMPCCGDCMLGLTCDEAIMKVCSVHRCSDSAKFEALERRFHRMC